MKHYVGLDVSMKETAICVVDETGSVVHESEVDTDPSQITECLKQLNLPIEKLGLESGCLSHYLVKELRKSQFEVVCMDARKMATLLSVTINKTDRNDARGIAQAVRAHLYREVHQKSDRSVQMGSVLSIRRTLVTQRTHLTNSIRGLLKPYGIRLGVVTRVQMSSRVRLVTEGLDSVVQLSFECLLQSHDFLCVEIQKLDAQVKAIAEEVPEVALLMTIPGVGLITALSFVVEIDDPGRFADSRDVGAYLGLTPRQYSSGETVRQGRISKCGSPEMRSLLYEAALVMMTRTKSWSKLKVWGLKLKRKSGTKKAAVALGRKLAVVMHRMLVTGKEFSYGEQSVA